MPRTFVEMVSEDLEAVRRQSTNATGASRFQNSSLDDTSLPVLDRENRVKATWGKQPDGSFGGDIRESPAQPTPTAPIIGEGDDGSTEIIWNGRTTDTDTPIVHGHIEVIGVYSPDDADPDLQLFRRMGTIRDRKGNSTVVQTPRPGLWIFRLQMIGQDRTTRGPVSAPTSHDVPALVDRAELREAFDAINGPDGRLPALERDLATASAELGSLRTTTIPEINQALAGARGEINTIRETTIPGINNALTGVRSEVTQLREVTVPAIGRDLSGARGELAELRETTIPGLSSELSALERVAGEGFEKAEREYLRLQAEADAAKAQADEAARLSRVDVFQNGGFESGTEGWGNSGSPNLWEADARAARSGELGMLTYGDTRASSGPYPVEPGDRVRVTYWIRRAEDSSMPNSTFTVGLTRSNGTSWLVTNDYHREPGSTLPPGEWVQHELDWTVPQDYAAGQFWLRLGVAPLTDTEIHLDDFKMFTGSGAIASEARAAAAVAQAAANAAQEAANNLRDTVIPGLESSLSTARKDLATLNDSTIPGIRDTLGGLNASLSGLDTRLAVEAARDGDNLSEIDRSDLSTVRNQWPMGAQFSWVRDQGNPSPDGAEWLIRVASETGSGYPTSPISNDFAVKVGEQLLVEYEVRGEVTAGNFAVNLRSLNAERAVARFDAVSARAGGSLTPGWTTLSGVCTVRPGEAYLRAEVKAYNLDGWGEIGRVRIRRMVREDLIVPGAVSAEKIAALAVIAEKIAAEAITAEKIAALAVEAEKLAANAVTARAIRAEAVNADKLAANAVTAVKILAGAVSTEKLAASSVSTEKLIAEAVTAAKIAVDAVTAEKIEASAVTAVKIAAEAITAAKIDSGAVTTEKLAALAVTAAKISALAVTAEKIAADAVTAEKVAANAITAEKIAAEAITAEKIAAESVGAAKIDVQDLAVDEARMNVLFAGMAKFSEAQIDELLANTGKFTVINSKLVQSHEVPDRGWKLQPTGEVEVYGLNNTSGEPQVKLGNAVTEGDLFTLTDELGDPSVTMNSSGSLSAQTLASQMDPTFSGKPLAAEHLETPRWNTVDSVLDYLPQGVKRYWERVFTGENFNSGVSQTGVGIAHLEMVCEPNRLYNFRCFDFEMGNRASYWMQGLISESTNLSRRPERPNTASGNSTTLGPRVDGKVPPSSESGSYGTSLGYNWFRSYSRRTWVRIIFVVGNSTGAGNAHGSLSRHRATVAIEDLGPSTGPKGYTLAANTNVTSGSIPEPVEDLSVFYNSVNTATYTLNLNTRIATRAYFGGRPQFGRWSNGTWYMTLMEFADWDGQSGEKRDASFNVSVDDWLRRGAGNIFQSAVPTFGGLPASFNFDTQLINLPDQRRVARYARRGVSVEGSALDVLLSRSRASLALGRTGWGTAESGYPASGRVALGVNGTNARLSTELGGGVA